MQRCACRNRRQIRNATDVLRNAALRHAPHPLIAIKKIVEERHQRRAFASGRDVCGTKIGDHRHTQPRRDHRALAGLPRYRQLSSEKPLRYSLVIERLSMTAHQVKFHAMLARCLRDRLRVQFAEKEIQAGQIRNVGQFRVHHGQDCAPHWGRERILFVRKQCEV